MFSWTYWITLEEITTSVISVTINAMTLTTPAHIIWEI